MSEKTNTKNNLKAGAKLVGAVAVGAVVVFQQHKIRGLQKAQKELSEQSRTDALTGLPNRRAFEESFGQHVARRQREGGPKNDHLLIIDLDGFKGVNDTYGHPAGDELLKTVGEQLRGALRTEDILARLGGDEFAVLLVDPSTPDPNKETEDSVALAERLVGEVEAASNSLNPDYGVSTSIGAGVINPALPFEENYKPVDSALYDAKRAGKARVTHVPAPPTPDN